MAIDTLSRRSLLGALGGLWWSNANAQTTTRLFAAWGSTGGTESSQYVGLLQGRDNNDAVQVLFRLAVPTRAHGLVHEPDGTLLAVARRPGDWLVRWHPARGQAQWFWNEPGHVFNGHVERRGSHVYSTQTDLESGQGFVAVHDARTLRTLARWPTHGRDPHELLFGDDGALWVANGGIGTDAASGRTKDTHTMDSSLVRLDADTGALHGQWRLADAKLSLRHLARSADGCIGVALQAEHEEATLRAEAPLLAIWHNDTLREVPGPAAEAGGQGGYGGDITAHGGRFFVSATRAGRVLAWSEDAGWSVVLAMTAPCALVSTLSALWCAGSVSLVSLTGGTLLHHRTSALRGLRLDNHVVAA